MGNIILLEDDLIGKQPCLVWTILFGKISTGVMFSYKGNIDITCKNSTLTAQARLNLIIPAKWDGFDGRKNPHIIKLTKYLNNTPLPVIESRTKDTKLKVWSTSR